MTRSPIGVPASQGSPVAPHRVNVDDILWGPVTVMNSGNDRDRILSDCVFLVWGNRQVYAIHWRMPVSLGDHEEAVCVPAVGNRGLTELWQWLTDLRILGSKQIVGALEAAGALLHAMDPNSEHVTALLRHPDPHVRLETQLNLAKRDNCAADVQGHASSEANSNPARHARGPRSRRLPR